MIHKYSQLGNNIVLDVNSGGVHVLDEVAFRMLDFITFPMNKEMPSGLMSLMPEYPFEELFEAYSELYQLFKEGALGSEDDYFKFTQMLDEPPIKAMCLHVSHDCNLRCQYCFAGTGNYGGGRVNMSPDTAILAIDFLVKNSGNRVNLEVDFFGGEPLMAWETVKATVEYARSIEAETGKNFRFTMTTNGMLLNDEKIDFINKEMNNCVLSLDGRPEVTDKIRNTVKGGGCYDIIVPKFKKLVEEREKTGKDFYVRGTFTKYNLDFADDVIHMRELGFKSLSVEPVVSPSDKPYALTEEDLPQIFSEYDRLAKIMVESDADFNFFHFMIDLNQGPCAIKRLRGCGCGNEYVAITPDGDIFPCHQYVGMNEWKMGNIYEKSFNNEMKAYFATTHIYNKNQCQECWAKFYCSGGCNANSYQYEGDAMKVHKIACDMQKKRIESAIAIKAYQATAQ